MLRLHTNYHSLLHFLVQMGVLTQVRRSLHAPLYHQAASVHVQGGLFGALLTQPELLFADKPTSALSEQTETEIMEMFCPSILTRELPLSW